MADGRADTDEATALVRWLLEAGVDGLGLTKTHALRRAIVREAAERWSHWWRHELFGPPHRESDLPVLEATHGALRRLRLLRRERGTLLTTARGRRLLADPEALLMLLHEDLGSDGFEGDAWLLVEDVLLEQGALDSERLTEIVGPLPAPTWLRAARDPAHARRCDDPAAVGGTARPARIRLRRASRRARRTAGVMGVHAAGGPAPQAARATHAADATKRRKAERAARRRNRRR